VRVLSNTTPSPRPAGARTYVSSYRARVPLARQLCRTLKRSQSTYAYKFVKPSVSQFSKNLPNERMTLPIPPPTDASVWLVVAQR